MGDEATNDVNEHISFQYFVLSVLGEKMSTVVVFIFDNCSVSHSVSSKLNIPLMGCTTHRFQLTVKYLLKEYEQILKEVHNFMFKLQPPLISAKLRRITHRKPKFRNDKMWSSTHQMLK